MRVVAATGPKEPTDGGSRPPGWWVGKTWTVGKLRLRLLQVSSLNLSVDQLVKKKRGPWISPVRCIFLFFFFSSCFKKKRKTRWPAQDTDSRHSSSLLPRVFIKFLSVSDFSCLAHGLHFHRRLLEIRNTLKCFISLFPLVLEKSLNAHYRCVVDNI